MSRAIRTVFGHDLCITYIILFWTAVSINQSDCVGGNSYSKYREPVLSKSESKSKSRVTPLPLSPEYSFLKRSQYFIWAFADQASLSYFKLSVTKDTSY